MRAGFVCVFILFVGQIVRAANPVIGCYDMHEEQPAVATWPPLRFTDEPADDQGHHWHRIVSLDPRRQVGKRSYWRDDDPRGLIIYFGPDDYHVADAFSTAALLNANELGYSGELRQTGGFGTRRSNVELRRRLCPDSK